MSSFAQTIGGAQNQSALDLSEFPSLSGNSIPAQSQAIWGSSNQRLPQTAPVQRPQTRTSIQTTSSQPSQATQSPLQTQSFQSNEQLLERQSSVLQALGSTLDDNRFDDRNANDRSRMTSQHGTTEDFPPLGGLGDISDHQPRSALPAQNTHFNGLGSDGTAFANRTSHSDGFSPTGGKSNYDCLSYACNSCFSR